MEKLWALLEPNAEDRRRYQEAARNKWVMVAGLLSVVLTAGLVVAAVRYGWSYRILRNTDGTNGVELALFVLLTPLPLLLVFVHSLERVDARRRRRPLTVEVRIARAAAEMQNTYALLEELQAEMATRTAALTRLQTENAEFERLASVRRDEAEAVTRLVESVIGGTHDKLERRNRRDQWLFFLAGLVVSPILQWAFGLLLK